MLFPSALRLSRALPLTAALITSLLLGACASTRTSPDSVAPADASPADASPANSAPVDSAPVDKATVRLIALNDFHGYLDSPGSVDLPDPASPGKTVKAPLGGAAYLASLIQQLKADNPLNVVVGAGDMVGASPLSSSLYHDEGTVQALSQAGLEFTSVGNHEFDKGEQELLRLQHGGCLKGNPHSCLMGRQFKGAGYQYLAANVIDTSTGQPLFPPYAIKRFVAGNGQAFSIAFIGLVLKDTPTIVNPTGVAGLRFTDEAAAANALLPELKARGVNAVVVLIHQGVDTQVGFNDKSCAGAHGDLTQVLDKLDPSIKLVISGHTHQAYICDRGQGSHNTHVFYTSAGKYGEFVTALDVTLNTRHDSIIAIHADNRPVVNDSAPNPEPNAYPTLKPDPAVATLVQQYDRAAARYANRIVGHIKADIAKAGGDSGESPLGDLIADAQLDAAQLDSQPPVVAFMNPGGIRNMLFYRKRDAGLPANAHVADGQISYGEAKNVQPFNDELMDMDLSGAQIYALLDQQWTGRSQPLLLQVSRGFSYSWDARRPEGSSRIVEGSVMIHGVPVDRNKTYRIEANDFLANGGNKFSVFTQGRNIWNGPRDIDALVAYLKEHSPVRPPRLERIRRLN